MARLRQDLRYALRTLLKAPGFTLTAVLVLGIGIGANTAIFSIVNELVLRPLSGHADELVGVYSHDRTKPDSYRGFSYPNYVDLRASNDVFEQVMAHSFSMAGTPQGDTTKRTFVELVSSNYFDTLGVSLAAGRPFTLEEERPGANIPVVIVPYARWKKERLNPDYLGSTLRINAIDFTVVGVLPEGFTGTMALVSAEMMVPLGMFDTIVNDFFKNNGNGLKDRANTTLVLAGRLKPGVNDEFVRTRLDALSRQMEAAYPAENKNQLLTVADLSRMSTSTSPQTDGGMMAFTSLLLALAGVVLVIACLNLANMLLARGATRKKELAVRLAIGANRSRIITQLLTESLMLAIAGAVVGLIISYWTTRALGMSLAAALPLNVTFNTTPDVRVLSATIAFAALAAIAFGLGPALKLSRRDLVTDLKDLGSDAGAIGRRFGARNLMVIGQVALSLALLTAGGIFARTAIAAAGADPGYSYDRLLLASLDVSLKGAKEERGRVMYRTLLDRLRNRPGVEGATLGSTIPFGDTRMGELVERVGGGQSEPVNAGTYRIITADYFRTLGMPLIRGREFTRAEEESMESPRVAIVDEPLARRLFGDEDPIGQMIRIANRPGEAAANQEPMQVVGIAAPMREELLEKTPRSHFYVPSGRHYQSGMYLQVKIAPGVSERAALDALRADLRAVDPDFPVMALSTMRAFHEQGLELWALKIGARMFTALGSLALLLAVIGVYGVKSYVVAQRTREIGIRMALGATAANVRSMVLRDGLVLTTIGLAVGIPLALLVSVALTKVFVEVGGIDAVVIASGALALFLAATAATAIPARRATRVVPLRALRNE